MGYNFYNSKEEILYPKDSWEYDTLSPFKFCANNLFRINEGIKKGEKIRIIKNKGTVNSKTFIITNTSEFKSWLKTIFKGGFENYIDEALK